MSLFWQLDGCLDAAYSHMLLNMHFPKGFNFFSVRNENDNSYGRGIEIEKGIYDINGFQVRFFTKNEIRDLTTVEEWLRNIMDKRRI
jgi:hypothetical protein